MTTDLQALKTAFLAAPNDARAQAAFGEVLVVAGQAEQALLVLDRPHDGDPAWVRHKLSMLSFALDGAGGAARAHELNISLLSVPGCAGFAAAVEACRHAAAGEHDRAVAWFHRAARFGILEPRLIYGLGWQIDPAKVDLDFLLRFLPHRRVASQQIGRALIEGCAALAPEGVRLAQGDPIFGEVGDALSQRQADLAEAILSAHWSDYEAGRTSVPFCVGEYSSSKTAIKGRRGLVIVPSRFQRFGTEGEYEVWNGWTQSMRDAGMEVARMDSLRLQTDLTGAVVAELDRLVAEFQPDLVFFDAEETCIVPDRIGPEQFAAWRATYGTKFCAFLSDVHEHFYMHVDRWLEVLDIAFCMPFKGLKVADAHASGKLFFAATKPDMRSRAEEPDLPEKDIDFFFSGTANTSRKRLIDRLAPVFETCRININNLPGAKPPGAYTEYRETFRRSRFTLNSGLLQEFDAPRGRTVEAASAGVISFELGGSRAADMYVPFIHFIPVASEAQALVFARFLQNRPDWRDRISAEARRFHFEHYGADHLWQTVFARLDAMG